MEAAAKWQQLPPKALGDQPGFIGGQVFLPSTDRAADGVRGCMVLMTRSISLDLGGIESHADPFTELFSLCAKVSHEILVPQTNPIDARR